VAPTFWADAGRLVKQANTMTVVMAKRCSDIDKFSEGG
jgi:hypothetical protein